MIWLTIDIVSAIHEESLSAHGGASGIRDEGLLASVITRARMHHTYANPEPDVWELAAVLCEGIVKNHPFIDGNKRTGIVAAAAFLAINGHVLKIDEAQGVLMVRGLADSSVEIAEFKEWLRRINAL